MSGKHTSFPLQSKEKEKKFYHTVFLGALTVRVMVLCLGFEGGGGVGVGFGSGSGVFVSFLLE